MSDRTGYKYLCVQHATSRYGFILAKKYMVFFENQTSLLDFWETLSRTQKTYFRFYDICDNMKLIKKTTNCEELIL